MSDDVLCRRCGSLIAAALFPEAGEKCEACLIEEERERLRKLHALGKSRVKDLQEERTAVTRERNALIAEVRTLTQERDSEAKWAAQYKIERDWARRYLTDALDIIATRLGPVGVEWYTAAKKAAGEE